VLSVDKVLSISGDVGLETGHVNHPGMVMISGDVTPGSVVECGGDLEVNGVIHRAALKVGGDIRAAGGINGGEEQPIVVEGKVSAKYTAEAAIDAKGDIEVRSEAIHSCLRTQGVIRIAQGRLVGGEATALGGIVVGQAGSDGSVPTLLVAGEDYLLPKEVDPLKKKVGALEKKVRKVHDTVDPLMVEEKRLTARQRELATELLAHADEIEMDIEELRVEIEKLEEASRELAADRIVIQSVVHPATTLRIRGIAYKVQEMIRGPVAAVLDAGEIRFQQVTGKL
jgi:uncharacterized protein (DUF342 family)